MSKPIVLFLIGYPGSGKTYLANRIKDEDHQYDWIIVDDPRDKSILVPLIENFEDIIVTDPHLCNAKIRKEAIKFFTANDYQVEFWYFENNPEKCMVNLKHRNDDRNIKTLKAFNYTIPKGTIPEKIWQPKIDKSHKKAIVQDEHI